MKLEEIVEKYSCIEEKVPSVWEDYEKVAIELSQDIATEWDIKDGELIRVLALVDMRVAGMGKPTFGLSKHIYAPFAFMGLYPERMKSLEQLPDGAFLSNVLQKTLKRMSKSSRSHAGVSKLGTGPGIQYNPECTNKNCIGGVITSDGQSGRFCKKCNPTEKSSVLQLEKDLEKEASLISEAIEDVITIASMNPPDVARELLKCQFVIINRQDL